MPNFLIFIINKLNYRIIFDKKLSLRLLVLEIHYFLRYKTASLQQVLVENWALIFENKK